MRRRSLLLAAGLAALVTAAAMAQSVLDAPRLDPGNPGEPTTGAGDLPRPETIPEGATRPDSRRRTAPTGSVEVDPRAPGPPMNVGRTPTGAPVIGTDRLLTSLDELDRPLTPEEITAYAATVQREIPLRPELIADFRRRLNDVARARAAPPSGVRPISLTDTVRISLSTAGEPETILTAPGTVTVMSFFDRTGAPWPVAAYVIGNESAFQVYPMQEGSHELALSPLVTHGYSNIVVSLVDADQPIVLDVETNEERSHRRRDVVVDATGPNAVVAPVVPREPSQRSSDGIMMAMVQGAPIPPDARKLRTDDPDVEAYRLGRDMYVRTNRTLISPAYNASIAGPGGINAYRLRPAPVVMISRGGAITRVRISG